MFNTFEQFIRKLSNFLKSKKLDIILFGIDKDNPEMFARPMVGPIQGFVTGLLSVE